MSNTYSVGFLLLDVCDNVYVVQQTFRIQNEMYILHD